ncbi:Na+/proline symporter [Gottschalkia purinilytica]|uniref:Na+/proline symporter n=1 Tax=Gottschalkia purinilytica TaxID=1503 RepID=A0A0L0WAM7_GOTPU|nr:sodium:solute symporter family protein [Gottschalkia purinilytica]KNF08492.1 Na+/proline symporter [Gottschalkia purinilytica]
MVVALIIYVLLFLGIGLYNYFQANSYDDYVVAGRKQSQPIILMSLLSTIIGGSATFGTADMVYNMGFPAFWWLGVGGIGLILQSIFLSKKIRDFDAYTLPDIANKIVGEGGKLIIAFIIVTSWTGIIASQFTALSQIFSVITGSSNTLALLIIVSITVIIYTAIGGQLSVIKTDAIQFVILAIGIVCTFYYLFFSGAQMNVASVFSNIELFNDKFNWLNLINLLFIVGGTYFIGPDMFSRNLAAKDGKVAKKAAFNAGILLFFFSFLITSIGLWAKLNITDLGNENPLVYMISNHLPTSIGIALAIGLVSALISSADTCLITTATIIENDILKRNKVSDTRIFVLAIGLISLLIAVLKQDIISLLLGAYSVYAPGIVCPLLIAIWFYKKKEINKILWFLAIIVGGSSGILDNFLKIKYLPLIGMGCSLILSVLSVFLSNEYEQSSDKNLSI